MGCVVCRDEECARPFPPSPPSLPPFPPHLPPLLAGWRCHSALFACARVCVKSAAERAAVLAPVTPGGALPAAAACCRAGELASGGAWLTRMVGVMSGRKSEGQLHRLSGHSPRGTSMDDVRLEPNMDPANNILTSMELGGDMHLPLPQPSVSRTPHSPVRRGAAPSLGRGSKGRTLSSAASAPAMDAANLGSARKDRTRSPGGAGGAAAAAPEAEAEAGGGVNGDSGSLGARLSVEVSQRSLVRHSPPPAILSPFANISWGTTAMVASLPLQSFCAVCLEEEYCLITDSCLHRLCTGCARKCTAGMKATPLACPTCRRPVQGFCTPTDMKQMADLVKRVSQPQPTYMAH